MSNADDFTFEFDDVSNELDFSEADKIVVLEEKEEPVVEPEAPKDEPSKTEEEEKLHTEYLVIYDSIMFEDKFEKVYKLGKKYSAIKISRQLDNMDFSTMHALQTMSAVLTMSHSLIEVNGTDLSKMTVPERYNLIRTKSSHLIEVLSRHMINFDALVRNALEYGEENF